MQIQTQQPQKSTSPRETNQSGTTIVHATSANTYGPNLSDSNQSTLTNQIHQKFVEYGKNAKEWLRKCALLLPEIEKYEIWKKKGFDNIYEYARQIAGMSRDSVNEALRVLKKISDKPFLLKIVEEKGLQRIRPIAAIATVENQEFWTQKASSMSKNTLETYVKDYKLQFLPREAAQSVNTNNGENCESLTMEIKPEIASKLRKFNQGDWNELMQKFIDLYEKNLEQELKQEKPALATDTSSHIPKKIHDYVLKRSHGKCEFSNCNKKYEHLHHTNRFASDKTHDPDKIVALCIAHHDLAHRGLIENENDVITSTWKIQKEPDYTNLNWYIDQQIQAYKTRAG
jgi:hypothetical protein